MEVATLVTVLAPAVVKSKGVDKSHWATYSLWDTPNSFVPSGDVESILESIKSGGTLITLGKSSDFAIDKLRVPAHNVLKDLDEKEFYTPGSLLSIKLDNTHRLSYGMNETAVVRYTNKSPAFNLRPHIQESKAVGYFEENNPLKSGWLIGAEKLEGKTALAIIPVEKGNVIMFGFRPQSRGQTFGTFKLLFNAIYY